MPRRVKHKKEKIIQGSKKFEGKGGKKAENIIQIGNPYKDSVIIQLLLNLKIIPEIGLNKININHEDLDRWKLKG